MFNRKYIFNPGPFSIAMLVYRRVHFVLFDCPPKKWVPFNYEADQGSQVAVYPWDSPNRACWAWTPEASRLEGKIPSLKPASAPENGWLVVGRRSFPFGKSHFLGGYVSFRGGLIQKRYQNNDILWKEKEITFWSRQSHGGVWFVRSSGFQLGDV